MAKTNKGGKGPGYEYWSRRPYRGGCIGRYAKLLTHRRERLIAKSDLRDAGVWEEG